MTDWYSYIRESRLLLLLLQLFDNSTREMTCE